MAWSVIVNLPGRKGDGFYDLMDDRAIIQGEMSSGQADVVSVDYQGRIRWTWLHLVRYAQLCTYGTSSEPHLQDKVKTCVEVHGRYDIYTWIFR